MIITKKYEIKNGKLLLELGDDMDNGYSIRMTCNDNDAASFKIKDVGKINDYPNRLLLSYQICAEIRRELLSGKILYRILTEMAEKYQVEND